jgi:phosphohistidine phosphatase SixA
LRNLPAEAIAVVGHLPDLGFHTGWLIGSKKAQIDYAKGGVARVHFPSKPEKGSGVLVWLVTPEWLAGHEK